MKLILTGFSFLAIAGLVACGNAGDPEKEKRYTDSLATARYDERVTYMKDSLDRTCQERVTAVQRQIDSLNTLISAK